MQTQIPIYRAKKIDSDEYVEGFLTSDTFISTELELCVEIDPSTLAIHFPNMIDSEGTKIFASLSEDGNGGDLTIPKGIDINDVMAQFKYVAMFDGKSFRYCYSGIKVVGIKVVGIKKC